MNTLLAATAGNTGLAAADWYWIVGFFVVSLAVGLLVTRRAGKSSSEFFLSGRNMPWWLLGVSMVATTFSTDTPNLVTGIVRENGVAGNWVWWAFLLTGMLTVFVYAKLWRRSGITTDVEFYEIRYSGSSAAFLRGFRALYLGVFFNVMIMATVSIAAIKIGSIMFGFSPAATLLIAGSITVIYSMMGGLTGVIMTDFVQFSIAMIGSIVAAILAVRHPAVGGLDNLLAADVFQPHWAMADGTRMLAVAGAALPTGAKLIPSALNFLPDPRNLDVFIPLMLVPIAVQWWSVWYPGSEPGGGGYIAQRMLSAKDEKHAVGATLFFQCAHYALRPWPWIVVALCSMVVFPGLDDLRAQFPNAPEQYLKHDIAYPAMLKTVLPPGLLGLVVASLIAAYMSTISTHLNWGSSYVVNDFYKRFVRPDADEKSQVFVGRVSTVVLMVLASIAALYLEDAVGAFQILLQIGAGTGLLFILRWFWWRINAWSEIAAMVISFIVAVAFKLVDTGLTDWAQLVVGVGITSLGWISVTLLTPPTDDATLRSFVALVRPGGAGWGRWRAAGATSAPGQLTAGILCMMLGCAAVYSVLFATGFIIYGQFASAVWLLIAAGVSVVLIMQLWNRTAA